MRSEVTESSTITVIVAQYDSDSVINRHPTHATADWSGDMVWMLIYFSLGVWSSILLMWAPRAAKSAGAMQGAYVSMQPEETSEDQL